MVEERPVRFDAGGIELEGLLAEEGTGIGVVVCHPHPLYGGEMHNNVVEGICRCLRREGVSTLRFNFRGTGGSQGAHAGGEAEREDVRAAVGLLLEGSARVAVCGYSFGAAVGAQAGCTDPRVEAVAAVALPVGLIDAPAIRDCVKAKLLVAGERDEIAPRERIARLFEALPDPKTLEKIPGADHFFLGREQEVGDAVARFVLRCLKAD